MVALRYGTTRVVLLVGERAIKIGRVRPLRVLSRFLLWPFSARRRKHFLEKYGPGFGQAVLHDLCAGLYANRTEYEYYQRTRDVRVMPTTAALCGGWIVLQPRGSAVCEREISQSLGQEWLGVDCNEVVRAKQFCRTRSGAVVLIDYGKPYTCALLSGA